MVATGWAVAYRKYSLEYVADEVTARNAGLNIWSGTFDMPWDWRLTHK
jgi:endonuclease YncB( thermonuclease family)